MYCLSRNHDPKTIYSTCPMFLALCKSGQFVTGYKFCSKHSMLFLYMGVFFFFFYRFAGMLDVRLFPGVLDHLLVQHLQDHHGFPTTKNNHLRFLNILYDI